MKSCPTCKSTYPHGFVMCPQDGTPLQELGAWSEGTVIKGKYRILAKLGEGGMGAVYKALHLRFNELRAVKVISAQLASDSTFISRFEKEAVLTRRLQHPNAVRVDDIDEAEDGRPFMVMEYMDGQSLKEPMRALGALPLPRVCSIIKQVASALDAAHRLGIIHRDIKPENIILITKASPASDGAPQEIAKVLDFGIAKMKEAGAGQIGGPTLTETGVLIGSPPYMSPEQAKGLKGDELDGRSDLYSLGIVMFQMLTGTLPIKADTTMSMLMAHIQSPPLLLHEARPDLHIPDSISSLVMRLLEKRPESRPQTAQAVIQAIENAENEIGALGGATMVAPASAAILQEAVPLDATRKVRTEELATGAPFGRPPLQTPEQYRVETPPSTPSQAAVGTGTPWRAPARESSPAITPAQAAPESGPAIAQARQKSFFPRYVLLIGIIIIAVVILVWRVLSNKPAVSQAPPPQPASVSKETYEESHARGHELMRQHDYGGAIVEFRQALKLRPDLDELRLDLALAFEAKGQKQEAFEEFEVVCTRTPDLRECTEDYPKLRKELKEVGPRP